VKPGTLVRILNPEYSTLGHCAHGIILSEFVSPISSSLEEERTWRILCDDRTAILFEYEFEVIER
jgi:hypothetical protein